MGAILDNGSVMEWAWGHRCMSICACRIPDPAVNSLRFRLYK